MSRTVQVMCLVSAYEPDQAEWAEYSNEATYQVGEIPTEGWEAVLTVDDFNGLWYGYMEELGMGDLTPNENDGEIIDEFFADPSPNWITIRGENNPPGLNRIVTIDGDDYLFEGAEGFPGEYFRTDPDLADYIVSKNGETINVVFGAPFDD